MKISICSYSFHGLLKAGQQNIHQYIKDCKMLGCTQLDPWNGHLTEEMLHDIVSVKETAYQIGLPFGCIAVDGAHIYEEHSQMPKLFIKLGV